MVAEADLRGGVGVNFGGNFAFAFVALVLGGAAMLHYGARDPALHTVLDSSVALTAALVALLLWDVSRRTDQSWPLFLAISFAMLASGELLHVVGVLGWLGSGPATDVQLRSGSWGPPALLLPIGVGASMLLRNRSRSTAWAFAGGLALLAAALVAIFLSVPRYTDPGLLWVSRPSLILITMLWVAVGAAYWHHRGESEIAHAMAVTAATLATAHAVMLYSRAPDDTASMIAHFGKFVGEGLLLFNLTQIGAADTERRHEAEQQLLALNGELDARVNERTVRLRESN